MAYVLGDREDNILRGTAERDYFNGYGGADRIFVGSDAEMDVYRDTGRSGIDRIIAAEPRTDIFIGGLFSAENGFEVISSGGHAGVSIRGSSGVDRHDYSGLRLEGIRKIELGGGDDVGVGSAGHDDLRGNNGDDEISGGPGNDRLYGGSGNDNRPRANAEHGADGNDLLRGGPGDDRLSGGADDDTLSGGQGNDILYGSTGLDILSGGAGADRFLYRRADETGDIVRDFDPGTDVIDLTRLDTDGAALSYRGTRQVMPHSITHTTTDDTTWVHIETTGDTISDLEIALSGAPLLWIDDFLF